MFTGIIQAIGRVADLKLNATDMQACIETGKLDLTDIVIGDSIAVSGVCLTVVELPGKGFWADVSGETQACTTFSDLHVGQAVNLEKALTPTTRLGGHLVSGHVDGVGEVVERLEEGISLRLRIKGPDPLARYIAAKGSICVDGISLTINRVEGAEFALNIVPHTLAETTLDGIQRGDKVNLEVDIIARYLERLLLGDKAAQPGSKISRDLLIEHGFIQSDLNLKS